MIKYIIDELTAQRTLKIRYASAARSSYITPDT